MTKILVPVWIVVGCILTLGGFLQMSATDFTIAQRGSTINQVLLGPTTSNKTGTATFVESVLSHTFQIVTLCTNASSNVISASLNSTNWTPVLTNYCTASATNLLSLSGKWSYFQAAYSVTTASGSTNTVLYLGGN